MKIKNKNFLLLFVGFLIIWVLFCVYLFKEKLFVKIPQSAKAYSVAPLSCSYQEKICSQISFDFSSSEKAVNKIPEYSIQEFSDEAKTEITFKNVSSVEAQFNYNEVINNPLIESIDYYQRDNNFVVEIKRNGAFLPAEINQNGSVAAIVLKEGDQNFPQILDQKPANNSIAYPSLRKIRFGASLKDSLKKAVVLFQDEPVEFSEIEISPNQYQFEFTAEIIKDEQYKVTAIIIDSQDRTTVGNWEFEGQIPSQAILGNDRFKYLGWWGKINADGVSVRKGSDTSSKKIGTFSSINRVKVLKEVTGETINDNSIWYEIDGGQYPNSYVFSEYITPMIQPTPPQDFIIPIDVERGEYWIDVDLTKKILTLFEYDKPVFSTYISPGRKENPTIEGTFRVWYKLIKTRMRGGPPLHSYKYDLTDVPHVLFYEGSYAIHGTYWHDRFGTQQSAGCTNLTRGDATFIFDKVNPKLATGKVFVLSSKDNLGTVVHNHY
jgi:lipoprotein-anchoring transpeptidase ErfK/SrfK